MMFVVCTENEQITPALQPPCQPCPAHVEQKDPAHTGAEGGEPPSTPEWGTPSSRCRGTVLQSPEQHPHRCARRSGLQRCQGRRSAHTCQSQPGAHPPPSPAHSIRGGTERGYNRRSRSRVWGCVTPTYRS